jgi:hypothetical protein
MRFLFKLGTLALAGVGAKSLYEKYLAPAGAGAAPSGRDTPTGTDPAAKYTEPGYQDKSLGQAVSQDEALVEQLLDETDGNIHDAEARFANESAGAPTLKRQKQKRGGSARS